MKDKNGKNVAAGTWLLCVNDVECGELLQVISKCGTLMLHNESSDDANMPLSEYEQEGGCLQDFIVVRDPNKPMGYVEAARRYRDVNLAEAACEYWFSCEHLTLEQEAYLLMHGSTDVGEETARGNILEMADAGIDFTDIPEYGGTYWEETGKKVMSCFLRPANHYLVFAGGCRWNGASGYTITDSIEKTVERDYEVAITPVVGTPSGKTLVCRESSHDVPTGSETVIIALTDEEYEALEDAYFEKVSEFAEEYRSRAIRYYKD